MSNRITESSSNYDKLEEMSLHELLTNMNREDKTVPLAIEKAIPQIEKLAKATFEKLDNGGRLFYIGAGTSGRLGIVDASECPPTYGVPHGMVIGLIAGGDSQHLNLKWITRREQLARVKSFLEVIVNRDPKYLGEAIPITGNSLASFD